MRKTIINLIATFENIAVTTEEKKAIKEAKEVVDSECVGIISNDCKEEAYGYDFTEAEEIEVNPFFKVIF